MRLLVFPQYAKLIAHFRAIASACAAEKARWPICRVEAQNGVAHLHDHAMNVLALTGGTTTIILPDIIPGKARSSACVFRRQAKTPYLLSVRRSKASMMMHSRRLWTARRFFTHSQKRSAIFFSSNAER